MIRLTTPAIVALGIAAYLAFLVATIPASLLADRAHAAGIDLTDVRGTAWNGAARADVHLAQATTSFDSLEWRFLPSRLAAGRLAFDVKIAAPGLDMRAQLSRGFSGLEVRDLLARGDAQALAVFSPLAATWRPQGTLTLTAPALALEGNELRGTGRIEWRGAAVSLSEVRPLGSYRAELTAQGGPAKVAITTLEGPLRLSGEGTLTPQSGFAFTGEARGEGNAAAALEPLLTLMGPRSASGARELRWSQR